MKYSPKDVFEQMAGHYDTPERERVAKIIAEAIRTEVGDAQDKRAMDYGCGTGLVGLTLTGCFASMLFVDTSPQMIAQVDRKIKNASIENATTLSADFAQEVPQGIAVDYILMSQVLLHVSEYMPLLGRLHALLGAQGHLIIVDFDRDNSIPSDKVHPGFDQEALMRQLGQIGFAATKAHTFYHGEKLFMNQDASLFILDAMK